MDALRERFEGAPPGDIIKWASHHFRDRVSLATSLTDAVLIDLALEVAPDMDVVFVDTGHHFVETWEMRDLVEERYGITIRVAEPDDVDLGRWRSDLAACCARNKVEPFRAALSAQDAWISGLRRSESEDRSDAPVIHQDRYGLFKINPIVTWTRQEVDAYIEAHDVPVHPLREQGYLSIGCAPCTAPVDPDENERAGRWRGDAKTECGLNATASYASLDVC